MNKLVLSSNGKPVTNSLLVAKKFGKQHRDVLRAIRNLIKELNRSAQNCAGLTAQNSAVLQMFTESMYYDEYSREQSMFIIDRDGFSLLVMGFTGSEALKFKIDFIMAFNQMENKLKSLQSPAKKEVLITEPIGERLGGLLKHYHLNKNSLSVKLGISSNSVIGRIVNSKEKGMSLKTIQRIMLLFPEINPDWLILGKGKMLKGKTLPVNIAMKELKAASQTTPEYFTIVGWATLNNMSIGLKLASSLGKKASTLCKNKGYIRESLPDPRFGRVHTYPGKVLEQVFNESIV